MNDFITMQYMLPNFFDFYQKNDPGIPDRLNLEGNDKVIIFVALRGIPSADGLVAQLDRVADF